jgi:transcriptional regulator with XRE-family HTH domain
MRTEYTDLVSSGNTVLAIPRKMRARHYMPMGYLDRVVQLRKKRGWTQGDLAERVGVEQPTIQRWENGKREPSFDQLFALARALDVSPASLIDPSIAVPLGPQLFVKGEVAAGVWREAVELPESDWQTFTGRADITADPEYRFGLRVVGDSMDLVYPHGTIVECVSIFGRVEAKPGRRVVIIRENDEGECEATVKELVEQDGSLWAVPRSTNFAHQPIRLDRPEPGIRETRIGAVVVASVRPE